MRISGNGDVASTSGLQTGNAKNEQDAVLESLQKQLQEAKKSIQDLASNKEMSAEMKLEKRKEIQQQIQDINRQIMQRKQELYKEQHEKSKDDLSTDQDVANQQSKDSNIMETTDMQSIIQGDTAVKSAKESRGQKKDMLHKAAVLETESKLDAGKGRVTEGKDAAAAELKSKAAVLDQKIGDILSDVQDKKDEDSVQKVTVDEEEEEKEVQDKKKKDAEPGLYVDEYR